MGKGRNQNAERKIRLSRWSNIQLSGFKCFSDHITSCGCISRTELQQQIFRKLEYFQSCNTADFSHPNNILSQCHLQQSVILSHFPSASRIFCPDPCHPDSVHLLLHSGDGWTTSSNPGKLSITCLQLTLKSPDVGVHTILKFFCS